MTPPVMTVAYTPKYEPFSASRVGSLPKTTGEVRERDARVEIRDDAFHVHGRV